MNAPQTPTYPPQAYAPQQPMVPAAPRAAAPTRPQPTIRAQAPEEPNPARPPLLTMPSPEQLGVALRPAAESATDWSALRARLKEAGIVSFQLDSLPDGRFRFTCWVPKDKPGLTQRIEAVADTEGAAVQLALQHVQSAR